MVEPPVETVNQVIEAPAAVAFKLVAAPAHIVAGDAAIRLWYWTLRIY
jgi:hypothetical protein